MKVQAEKILKNPNRDALQIAAEDLIDVAYIPEGVERDVDYVYHLAIVRTPQPKQSPLASVVGPPTHEIRG